ncbi:hypothetical protein [Phaffia rhodozyma]|uniref:Uncharacterized protein n=1 Tax=Phaffia rhodozyma TaxID=264483 RepID=A0A0F7SUI5_PHARH|nr:hypothetical protein [Phaffia rhodozyma]
MLDQDFICCCIPLINSGIYFILLENIVVGIVAGVLTLVPSAVVSSAVPSFTGWIFAILCFAVAAVQVLGLLGVVKEKKGIFRVYTITNIVVQLLAFTVAGVLILVSGLRHKTAVANCQSTYYTTDSANSTTSLASQSQKICEIFMIVDNSLMAGLWLLMFIVQSYLMAVTRLYRREQKEDHSRYFSMYSTKGGFPEEPENIPLSFHNTDPLGDAWNTRQSTDTIRQYDAGPPGMRNSGISVVDGEGYRRPLSEARSHEQGVYGNHEVYDAYPVERGHEQEYLDDGRRDTAFVPPVGGHDGYGTEEAIHRDQLRQQRD